MSGDLNTTQYVGSGAGSSGGDSGTTILPGGVQYVGFDFGTGSAAGTVIDADGTQYVGESGGFGTATGAIVAGGVQYVGDHYGTGTAIAATVSAGGVQHVGDNEGTGTATNTTIGAGGAQFVGESGGSGTTTGATIGAGGSQYVGVNGGSGTATGATVGGLQFVGESGGVGTATNATIESGGVQYVGYLNGTGTASGVTIDSGGAQHVGDSGTGTASSVTLASGGVQYVGENGGTGSVSGATVSGGFQFVGFSGGTGTATGATISGGVQYVGYSGGTGTASGVTVLEAGKQFVGYDGTGQATGTTVGAGANQYVGYSSGTGAATDTTISGGAQYVGDVSATGSADNTTIDGGEQYLGYSYGTGIAASTTIVSGYQYVGYSFASGSATGTLIDGGAQYVGAAISATGQATDTVIDGGAQYVGYNAGTGTASGTTISSGAQYVGDGELGVGTATDTLILNGGAQYVNSGGAATGDTLSAGGSAEIMSGAVADSVVIDGGTLTLDDGALVGAHGIAFAPDSNWGTLDLSAYGTFTPPSSFVISGFTGTAAAGGDTLLLPADIFDTEHLAWTQNSASQGTLQLIDDTLGEVVTSLTLAGTYDQNDFTLNQGLDSDQVAYAPCYRAGTRIATARGETAVEDLRVGDLVATASGGLRPVRWIGHRAVDLARHPAPENVWPVRVAAHAFGDNLPRRDLWVSPDHALAVDGALLRAIDLANGVSVAQVPCRRVDYWHVELDAHDILLAEGLPAESYLDTGNRTAFVDGGAFIEAFPDFKPKHWAQTCLPLKLDGERLARTKAHLIARLRAWGFDADADAAPHIVADGETFAPTGVSEWGLAFTLPEGRDNIALTSKTFVPAHIMPESSDTRRLGLCVARLRVDGADLPLDHGACPGAGWREAEPREGRFTHRWTDGAARLPAGARHIVVDLGGHGRFWRARAEDDVAFG